jgi:hypothetical protein
MEIIPKQEIVKVFLLDNKGKKKTVYVFQGSNEAIYETKELFSEIELEEISIYKVNIKYSNQQIHKDDSIRVLKKKLIQEFGLDVLSYDEIYLFSYVQQKINLLRMYQEITNNEKYDFTHAILLQVLKNLSLPESIVNEFNRKEIYSYDDLIGFGIHEKPLDVPVSVGQKFTRNMNYLFSSNPFLLSQNAEILYKPNPDNPFVEFENQLVFYFGDYENNTLYLTLASDVFDYAVDNHIQENFITQTYFPLLFNNDIAKKADFLENREALLVNNKTLIQKKTLKLYETVDMFYNIAYTKKMEIPYLERGVTYFNIVIHPNSKTMMPLDAIFKNIHATSTSPFVKFNPGSRKENIYRLYSTQTNKFGKRIPFLSKNIIMNLSKNTGKSRQMSIYQQCTFKSAIHDFFVDIDYNGDIHLHCTLGKPLSKSEMFDFIIENYNPLVRTMNHFLDKTGYIIDEFETFSAPNIEFVHLKYKAMLEKTRDVDLKEKSGCLTSIFDIIDDNVSEKALLRFKRVSNFQKMDAMNAIINEIYTQTNSERAVVESLVKNYQLTENDALIQISKFLNMHTRIQGAFVNKAFTIAENPGFETSLSVLPFEKRVIVEVDNINAIEYIDVLDIYIDTFIRMIQFPESIKIPASKMKQMCTRLEENVDESHVKNIIVASAAAALIQPITFGKKLLLPGEEDEDAVEDEDEGYIETDDFESDEIGYIPDEEEAEFEPSIDGTIQENAPVTSTFVMPEKKSAEEEEEDEGLIFDEMDGGAGAAIDKKLLDDKPFSKTNIFFGKMKRLEPKLFMTKAEKNFSSYAQACPSNYNKQPVILTQSEKDDIDKNHPGSYDQAIKYGSDPNNPYYYICPRYWCLLTNSSITEEEVNSGMCGTIIPKDAKKIPKGAYVYEFTDDKYHKNKEGNYVTHNPGFRDELNKEGYCLPCCYSNWNSEKRKGRVEQCSNPENKKDPEEKEDKQNAYYIVGFDKNLRQKRFGFLPPAVERFFQINHNKVVSKNNPALIRMNVPVLLRYGVEQSVKQSFIGCLADIYASQKSIDLPNISEMRSIIAKSITLDMFLKYNNGSLPSVFKTKKRQLGADIIQKYVETEFYKSLDTSKESQFDFLEDTVSSFENFLAYLQDENARIDHTYLWDVITSKNQALFSNGFNLVILNLVDNDITDKVEILCPVNSYSKNHFSSLKDSILLLKRGEFYEPIYLYELKENKIVIKKSFREENVMKNIKNTFAAIKNSMNNYCSPLPSMPKIYKFKQNLPVDQMVDVLQKSDFNIALQVMNYQGKIIGLVVTKPPGEQGVFVPSFPSAQIDGIKTISMESNIWKDYRFTRDELMDISKKSGLPCYPKMKVIENNVVIGILTETNQFVQIFPPSENIEKDGLEELQGTNFFDADKVLTTHKEGDNARVTMIKNIMLETKIYNTFRSTIRAVLNQFHNRSLRTRLLRIVNSANYTYVNKLKDTEAILRKLCKNNVDFVENMPEELLDDYLDIGENKNAESKELCLIQEDKNCSILIPKLHLVTGTQNEKLYFGRIADELIRYQRIRSFMFEPKIYLNISNTNYKINDDEFILLQSLLTNEYFENLEPFQMDRYVKNITYDFAEPVESQSYINTNIYDMKNKISGVSGAFDEEKAKCIKEIREVYGNAESYWKQILPKTVKEIVLNRQPYCSFYLLMMILYEKTGKYHSVNEIKQMLWVAYSEIWTENSVKIEDILMKQGKVDIIKKIKGGIADLETIIKSEEYYLTNLDIWVFSNKMNLPVVLFSEKPLKSMMVNVKWLVMGGKYEEPYYFIRSPIVVERNSVPGYQIVSTTVKFSDVRGFSNMIESGLRGEEEYKKSIVTFDTFLQEYKIL